MSSDEPLYNVLEFILNRASSAELEVIAEAVRRRQSPGKGLGGISPHGMAENVAEQVKQQLGGILDVQNISRQIVTDLIRQKEPNISDQELEVLLDNWLPGTARAREATTPPVEEQPISNRVNIAAVSRKMVIRDFINLPPGGFCCRMYRCGKIRTY